MGQLATGLSVTTETYGGYCEKHDNKLLLRKDRVSNEGICEACQALSPFLQEARIGGYRIAID
jgi:hypothetical protein